MVNKWYKITTDIITEGSRVGPMLEVLLNEYRARFNEDFPLAKLEGHTEIEVINILYDCLQNNENYKPGKKIENKFPDAPRHK